jgi:hypothetical protein
MQQLHLVGCSSLVHLPALPEGLHSLGLGCVSLTEVSNTAERLLECCNRQICICSLAFHMSEHELACSRVNLEVQLCLHGASNLQVIII